MLVRGAKALIVDDQGCVLVIRRSKTQPHVPHASDLPGGIIEDNETVLEGLTREIEEEISITLPESALSFVASTEVNNYYGRDAHIELYEATLNSRPEIALSFEHDKYEWVPIKQLHVAHELFGPLVEQYKSKH